MSTPPQAVSDPYAEYGGAAAGSKQGDPYAAYGGSVAPPEKANAYATYGGKVAQPAPDAFEQAVQHRMKAYGEPRPVAERHARATLPHLVEHPELAQPASVGQQIAEGISSIVGTNPHVTQQALQQMRQPGVGNKLAAGTAYLVSGIPFGGAPLAQAMLESGQGQARKAALHTAEAIPQLAMLPIAGEKVVSELVGREGAEFLPEAQQLLQKGKQALMSRPAVTEPAQAVTEQAGEVVAPRGPTTIQAMTDAAAQLGMQPADVFQRAAATGASAEEVLAGTQVLKDSFETLKGRIAGLDLTTAEGKQRALSALRDYTDVRDQVHGKLFGEAGRALRAARENREFEEPAKALAKAVGKLGELPASNQDEFLALTQKLVQADDSRATARFVRDVELLRPSSTMDRLHSLWLQGLLSGAAIPKKFLGDFTTSLLAPAEELLTHGPAGTLNYLRGMYASIPDAVANGWKVFSDDIGAIDAAEQQAIGSHPHVPAIRGRVGKVVNLPGRALAAISSFYHSIHFGASLWQQAFDAAEAEGVSGEALAARAAEIRESPTKKMLDEAYKVGTRRTYLSEPSGPVGKFLAAAPRTPGLRKVIPFARVPLNLLKISTEVSPFGWLKSGLKAASNAEFRGSPEQAQELARNAIGTVLGAYGFYLGYTGQATGAESQKLEDETGAPPFSVRIGPHSFSYKYLTPVSLGMAGAIAAGQSERLRPGQHGQALANAVASSLEAIGGIPLLSSLVYGVNSINAALRSAATSGNVAGIERGIGRQFTSAIPQAVADVAAMRDKFERQPGTLLEDFMERIPGLREQVPVRLNTRKQPEPAPQNLGGFSPVAVRPVLPQPNLGALQRKLAIQQRKAERRRMRQRARQRH